MKDQQKYSAEDLQRYHDGGMLPAEMQQLESAALDDPFLSEALEGFAHTDNAKADIDEIRSRLSEAKTKTRHLFPFRSFLRVAAVLLITVGVGYAIFRSSDDGPPPVVVAKIEKEKPLPTVNQDTVATSAAPSSQLRPENTAAENVGRKNDLIVKNDESPADRKRKLQEADDESRDFLSAKKTTRGDLENALQGKVPGLNITHDEPARQAPLANGSAPVSSTYDVLSNDSSRLAEVRVTASATRRPAKELGYATARVSARTISADSFQLYANQNRRVVFDNNNQIARGEVALIFETDRKGRAQNIQVSRSTCTDCEKEAKRLLKEAPRRAANNRSDSVIISF